MATHLRGNLYWPAAESSATPSQKGSTLYLQFAHGLHIGWQLWLRHTRSCVSIALSAQTYPIWWCATAIVRSSRLGQNLRNACSAESAQRQRCNTLYGDAPLTSYMWTSGVYTRHIERVTKPRWAWLLTRASGSRTDNFTHHKKKKGLKMQEKVHGRCVMPRQLQMCFSPSPHRLLWLMCMCMIQYE